MFALEMFMCSLLLMVLLSNSIGASVGRSRQTLHLLAPVRALSTLD